MTKYIYHDYNTRSQSKNFNTNSLKKLRLSRSGSGRIFSQIYKNLHNIENETEYSEFNNLPRNSDLRVEWMYYFNYYLHLLMNLSRQVENFTFQNYHYNILKDKIFRMIYNLFSTDTGKKFLRTFPKTKEISQDIRQNLIKDLRDEKDPILQGLKVYLISTNF